MSHNQSLLPRRAKEARPRQRKQSGWKRFTAAIGALVLGFSGLIGATTAAQAATPGIEITVYDQNGQIVGDGGTIPEGSDFILQVHYDAQEDSIAGKEIVLTLPANIDIDSWNQSAGIDSVTNNGDGTLTVKFKDPMPSDITEGDLNFRLHANEVDGNQETPISWTIGDDQGGVTIVVENHEEPPTEVEDGYNKSVNPNNLDGYVQNSGSPDYEFTGLNPEIANQVLTYTLVLSSAEARSGYSIEDTLAAGLGFVPDSFEATLTTADGQAPFAFTPAVTGSSFSGTVDVPAQSTLRITYQVQVTDIATFENLLREQYEARGNTPGNYEIQIPNDAVFGGEIERSVNVRLRGNIPGVGIGNNFAKTGSWTLQDVITDENGNLQPAAEMTYTLHANLTPWDGRNPNFTLTRNVVISDQLIDQASWMTGETDFISISGDGPITGLTQATGFTGTAADFAGDEYVGQYAIVGQTLLVNIGMDNTTNVDIAVKAQLDTVAGLTGSDDTTVVDGTHYPWNNRAQFYYTDGGPVNRDHNAGVVDLPDNYEEGVNDSAAFNKTAQDDEVQVQPGERAEVPYRFTINTTKEQIDPLNSRIVDEVNTEVFDLSDLSTVFVASSYSGTALEASDYAISVNGDGNLVIELSEAGKTKVAELPAGEWIIDIKLTTVPFDGKQTFEIYNRATLHGVDSEWDYWSDDDSEATSYGNEAEIRKRVFDEQTGEWVSELNALIEGDAFVNERFVYSIEVIPRGDYGEAAPVQIFTRVDNLPGQVEFIGFTTVDENGAPILDSLDPVGPQYMNGNIEAVYADGAVTIQQQAGTTLNPNDGRIVTFFAVDANDASQEIVNSIAGSDTVIKPYGEPSIDIEKWNVEGDERPAYEDEQAGALGDLLNDKEYAGDRDTAEEAKELAPETEFPVNFTVSNDGREDLVSVVVSDELTGGVGEIQDLSCDFSPLGGPATGTTWDGPFLVGDRFECTGTLPGMAVGDTHANLAHVEAEGILTGEVVEDEDEWHARVPEPSIDIEKWNVEGDETPEYDETGALLNDTEFAGDRDTAEDSKALAAGTPFDINFTISNDGTEDLVDIVVSDELTDGVGAIENLSCDFSPLGGPETGTAWDGVFHVGDRFECTGTLPAMEGGDIHADLAQVVGTGAVTGIVVDDEDAWHAKVPQPSIDVEKWTDEGEAPEYEEGTGVLLNDGYKGDFDKAPGKKLEPGKSQVVNFTVSNDGPEALLDIVVKDARTGGVGDVQDISCVFPDGSEGLTWAGPFEVGTQFECSGILPGLKAGESHSDRVTVDGIGAISGIAVDDADEWHGSTDAPLSDTGARSALWVGIGAAALLTIGLAILIARRRVSVE